MKQLFNLRLKGSDNIDPDGTRTHNPQLRRLMPYPLGHWVIVHMPEETKSYYTTNRVNMPFDGLWGIVSRSSLFHLKRQ